jgi:putative chitinase
MVMTTEKLKACLPACQPDKWVDPINQVIAKYDINTPLRLACFLSQTGYESNSYNVLTEDLNYNADQLVKYWPNLFTGKTAQAYAHQPERIANRIYGNRLGNGNESTYDGWNYRGRGIIQTTGKINYEKVSIGLNIRAVEQPDLLLTPLYAALSAGLYWATNGLNAYADKSDIITLTKLINGGVNGLSDRVKLFNHIITILK